MTDMTLTRLFRPSHLVGAMIALLITLFLVHSLAAQTFDGFTEPSRIVKVAAVEAGTVTSMDVAEGESVVTGQKIAQLDDDLYRALLAIAEESMNARGRLDSARAELALKQQRRDKLTQLREQGHAREEEVQRARTDTEIARAQLLAAEEQALLKRLECDRFRIQLERRTIRSPMDGVVTRKLKEAGEFVAPNDPYLVELVCLDPLMATFSVTSDAAGQLSLEQKVSIRLVRGSRTVEGFIHFVAPVTDAESGTIRIKVRLANSRGSIHSGERCELSISKPSGRSPAH